ncbi:MAG: hypothetical protein KKD18_06660 [Nanoarchaeota archaeon]|nr:hypothetical protein [Nanoarchaeota archaeon]
MEEIEKIIGEALKYVGKGKDAEIDLDSVVVCCEKAFALGKAEMLEEVKKEIDKIEFPNENVEHLRGFRDCRFKVKQRLENLNSSPAEAGGKQEHELGNPPLNFNEFVKELKDDLFEMMEGGVVKNLPLFRKIDELADKYRKRAKK